MPDVVIERVFSLRLLSLCPHGVIPLCVRVLTSLWTTSHMDRAMVNLFICKEPVSR
jgi:hypothetical protein